MAVSWGSASSAVAAVTFLGVLGYSALEQRAFLVEASPYQAARLGFQLDPFPESIAVAKYIEEHTAQGDRFAVLGSEPQIYFYADRLSATGFIYTYGLMENQKYATRMQHDMIREIEEARPEYMVLVNVKSSWLATPTSDRTIVDWIGTYARSYHRVGVVDIISAASTVYVCDDQAADYGIRSPDYLLVLKRNAVAER